MCDTLVGREDWRWPVCGWERWFLQQNRATEAEVRDGTEVLSTCHGGMVVCPRRQVSLCLEMTVGRRPEVLVSSAILFGGIEE